MNFYKSTKLNKRETKQAGNQTSGKPNKRETKQAGNQSNGQQEAIKFLIVILFYIFFYNIYINKY